MPINLGTDGNAGKGCAKFNSQTKRWTVRPEGGSKTELTENPVVAADLKNIVTCWARYRVGQPPDFAIDPSREQMAPRPSAEHSRGFIMKVFSEKHFGGAVEFSGNGLHLTNAIRDLFTSYEAEAPQHAGQVPVVAYTGATEHKDRMGINYRPQFAIAKWIPRPAELPDEPAATAESNGTAAPQQAPQGPAQQAQPQPATPASATPEF